MIGGPLLAGALTSISAGLPFLAAGLLNGMAITVALAFFAQLGRGRVARVQA